MLLEMRQNRQTRIGRGISIPSGRRRRALHSKWMFRAREACQGVADSEPSVGQGKVRLSEGASPHRSRSSQASAK